MADMNIYVGFPRTVTLIESDGAGQMLGLRRKVLYHPVHQPVPDLSYGHVVNNDCQGGLYLKWLAKKSDYQYLMTYPKWEKRIKTKSLGRIQNIDTNRARALSRTHEIGKTATVEFKVSLEVESDNENIASSILYSPEVYLWQEESILSGVTCSEFIKVFIKPGTFTVQKQGTNKQKLRLTIEIDQKNVQTLV